MRKEPPRAIDIMNAKPLTLTADTLVAEAARQMWRRQTPVAAVVDEDYKPVGVLSQQGLMLALLDVVNYEMPAGPVTDYLDPATRHIECQTTLLHIAEKFVRRGYAIRALTAVDRDGRLVGLVLRRDVVHSVMEFFSTAGDEQMGLYLSALKEADERPDFS